jgi:hypothetical protein
MSLVVFYISVQDSADLYSKKESYFRYAEHVSPNMYNLLDKFYHVQSREYGRSIPSRWPRGTPLSAKVRRQAEAGIVLSRTQATEIFSF